MSKRGGKRPGAGRPKGVGNRPKVTDYFTHEEIQGIVGVIKKKYKSNSRILMFIAEQLFGKAPQTISGDPENPLTAEKIIVLKE